MDNGGNDCRDFAMPGVAVRTPGRAGVGAFVVDAPREGENLAA